MADKIINALSTSKTPSGFLRGLTNKGIIGYILTKSAGPSVNCIILRITFKNGEGFLYTTDLAKETLTNLTYSNEGTLGSVFTERRPNTLRLHRFYHKGRLEHLLTTMPDTAALIESGYRDETQENPIYIYDRPFDFTTPLYLYTNSDYNPKPFVSKTGKTISIDGYSRQDAIQELVDILKDNGISYEQVTMIPDDQAITVSINDSLHNFYVNLQENKQYFTIRSKPAPRSNDYIKHDISSWINVVAEFQFWIDQVKNHLNERKILDLNKAKGILYLEEPSDYEFINDNIKPALNVETQTEIFFKLINSIKKKETGLLLGIFGRWGRGKTFFWRELSKKLTASENVKFTLLEFHAWKYQDTPASWAYLYEQFVLTFYQRSRKFLFWNLKLPILNRVVLNIKRLGKVNLLVGLSYLLFAFFWIFFVAPEVKINLILNILSGLGIPLILSIVYYYFSYSGLAKDLFKTYFSEVRFVNLLGVQAEIQKELQHLVEAWIPQKQVGKERLILFVDDIDRCSEDRIIQVIDSLKVMIDDLAISDRVIVIAAIDEIVLKRAIKSKYFDSVSRDLSLDEEQRKITLENLCREYMDKLFIGGFKLGNLSSDQNEELFRSIVAEKTFIQDKQAPEGKQATASDVTTQNTNQGSATPSSAQIKDASEELRQYISFIPKKEFEMMEYELDFMVTAVRKFSTATPRAIRILYYRYLLAKSFKNLLIKNNADVNQEWNTNQEKKTILPCLMIEYMIQKQHDELILEIQRMEKSTEEVIQITCLEQEFRLSRKLYLSLLKIVEIVVPY